METNLLGVVGETIQLPVQEAAVGDISVIICAYTEDRWNDLVEAVGSMKRQTVQPREIIVVIDHNPALYERVRREISGVVVLENRQARGLSGGRNTGVAEAAGSIIAFMDEDAYAEPDWLENILQGYAGEQVIGVGGAIQPAWVEARPRWFPEEFDWVVGCTYRGMPHHASPVRNLIGANMSFRKDIFDLAGEFTNGMGRIGTRPLGCEETEFCIRATQRTEGGRFLFEPRARVHHRVPPTRASWKYFLSRCYSEGLSKAQVSQSVGSNQGLSNERTYTFRTLPAGVNRGIADTLRGDGYGLARAGAIVVGLLTTAAGYLRGRFARQGQ